MSEVENVQTYTYATFQETNIEEHESWLTFIRFQGNEKNLEYLKNQIESIDWHCEDENDMICAFDIDTKNLVSEQTAKEMCKIHLNSYTFHRKFNGSLEKINLGLKPIPENLKRKKKEYLNDKNIKTVNKILSYCKISDYLSDEDIPEGMEDYNDSVDDYSSDSTSEDENDSEYSSDEDSENEKVILDNSIDIKKKGVKL